MVQVYLAKERSHFCSYYFDDYVSCLWSAGELIRGSVYGYPEKAYQKKKSWYCGSSSSSFDGGDRETISAMESMIAYLNAELAAVAE
ncbi:hypothetical protein KY290_025210 [Solanum tuberosum]|uniref:Uncharacterized protein n=1 Tax=Solanum tuberosum TaxID=4113 RepID=A0ABQ7USY8_SOLTU|nr:hypothetical protein KY284_024017 [Solanum tuberosum]KAH0754940.1 hypothetical protein KY290_025210 [Solanum tuberosum]